jgi:hypothetical protein
MKGHIMTSTPDRQGRHQHLGLGDPALEPKETPSRAAAKWGSAASALLIVVAGMGLSSPAWAKPKPKPTIAVQNSGSPFVSGSKFTPDGPVVLTEWAVGTKKPISTESENAESTGSIFFYLNCDGQQSVYFQAKDTTTHKKSNKTAPTVLVCIN